MMFLPFRRKSQVVVSLQGPSGCGKSTVASKLTMQGRWACFERGTILRCFTHKAILNQIPFDSPQAITSMIDSTKIRTTNDRVFMDDIDVTGLIASPAIEAVVDKLWKIDPSVNERLIRVFKEHIRELSGSRFLLIVGRGAYAKADRAFYLTLPADERARRRLLRNGQEPSVGNMETTTRELTERDSRDNIPEPEIGAIVIENWNSDETSAVIMLHMKNHR